MCIRDRYPDGAVLFLGTMFAPVKDRDTVGGGFTHKDTDIAVSYTHLTLPTIYSV